MRKTALLFCLLIGVGVCSCALGARQSIYIHPTVQAEPVASEHIDLGRTTGSEATPDGSERWSIQHFQTENLQILVVRCGSSMTTYRMFFEDLQGARRMICSEDAAEIARCLHRIRHGDFPML